MHLRRLQARLHGRLLHRDSTQPNPSHPPTNLPLTHPFRPQLNTSRIAQNLLNTTSSESSNPIVSFFDDITNSVQEEINDSLNSLAQDLGLHDFYSAHLLNYCEGFYTPSDLPNATLPRSAISKNVTHCSNRTALFAFNPRATLQRELDDAGHGDLNLTDLAWPEELDDGVRALATASKATFVLYCVGAALAFVALAAAGVGVFFEGRLSAVVNVVVDSVAFLVLGVASAVVTAVAVKAARVVNEKGEDVGVSAQRGGKFLALTWAATGLLFVASLVWCGMCVVGGRRRRVSRVKGKGYA